MELKKEFLEYYSQNLNLTQQDFDEFVSILKTPLPMTFRILDHTLRQHIESFNLATKVSLFNDVYECDKDKYKDSELRKTLIEFTNISKVYRQEIASMLPVYFLNVQETDFVLDMCAAPGSKSMQILEKIKRGLFIANDCSVKRCDILRSNIKQLCNPNVLITNHDSRRFPHIFHANKTKVYFDKILCDVPCSGDGTIRKNKDINARWNTNNSIGLMKTQFDILRRGLKMLNDDGILVYSTCSFNPLENECIVQRAVRECDCEILKVPPPQGFKFRPGLITWDPIVKKTENNQWYFPSDMDTGLNNCMRIFPQDQNTGGFFIAVLKLKKKKKIPVGEIMPSSVLESKVLYKSMKADFIFYNVDNVIKESLEQQFNIIIEEKLISQSPHDRQISLASEDVYNILRNNPQLFIISAGYIAFSKVGFKHEENLYRPKPNVLEQFSTDKSSVIEIDMDDALKLLEDEFVENEVLTLDITQRGCYIVKFEGLDDLYCLWRGPNKSGIMINRNYRNAIRNIIMFRKS